MCGMTVRRPRRLDGVSYVGYQRYLLTSCTESRRPLFASRDVVTSALALLRQSAALFEFAILAYCFMPDHLHVLVAGESERADFTAFVKRFKQMTGYAYKQQYAEPLWQDGYHERIPRNDEATETVVRYILENPVRRGLTRHLGEYEFAGSDMYDHAALLTAWDDQ